MQTRGRQPKTEGALFTAHISQNSAKGVTKYNTMKLRELRTYPIKLDSGNCYNIMVGEQGMTIIQDFICLSLNRVDVIPGLPSLVILR